jgi:hypothetical protein
MDGGDAMVRRDPRNASAKGWMKARQASQCFDRDSGRGQFRRPFSGSVETADDGSTGGPEPPTYLDDETLGASGGQAQDDVHDARRGTHETIVQECEPCAASAAS